MKLPLQPPRDHRFGIAWTSCAPFVENIKAVLIHRPRRITTYKISDKYRAHIGIECWCGTHFSGSKKFTFLDAPPGNKLLCVRCEINATKFGLPSAENIVGKHIHVGRVVAVNMCCADAAIKAVEGELK